MHKQLARAAAFSLLGAVLGGCGMSADHVTVSVGDSARIEVRRAASGHTSWHVAVGPRACRAKRVDVQWRDVDAQLRTC
jgi:hypothetical protein